MSYSSSMIRWYLVRSTMACTATQPWRCSGEIVGDSMPGVRSPRVQRVGAHVVGEHHVAASHQNALQSADQLGHLAGHRLACMADQHRFRLENRLADDLQPACRRVAPVSTTSAITSATPSRTAVSTAPSSRVTSA